MYQMKSTIDFPKMREIFFAGDTFSLSGTSEFTGTFHLFKETLADGEAPRTGRELKGEFHSALAGRQRSIASAICAGRVRWAPDVLEVTDAAATRTAAARGSATAWRRSAPKA